MNLKENKVILLVILAVWFVLCFIVMYEAFDKVVEIGRYATLISLIISSLESAALAHMLTYKQEL